MGGTVQAFLYRRNPNDETDGTQDRLIMHRTFSNAYVSEVMEKMEIYIQLEKLNEKYPIYVRVSPSSEVAQETLDLRDYR